MERAIPWGLLVLVMTALCFWKPRPMRGVMGIFFALMGLGVHGAVILTNPQAYVDFAGGALIPLYRDLAVAVVQVNPLLFGIGMLLFEVAVATSLLSHGRYVRAGLLAGVVFLVGISPLGIEVLPNVVLAVGMGSLLAHEYPVSAWSEFQQWRAARRERKTAPQS